MPPRLGLALASSLWWAYFLGDERGALRAMTSATLDQRFQLAINGYFYSYIPMLLGVIMIAAGVKRSIGHVMEPLEPSLALTLAAGVGLYLAGDVAFRRVMRIRPVVYRLGGAVAALGTIALGVQAFAAAQLVALLAIVVAALAVETTWHREQAARVAGRDGCR